MFNIIFYKKDKLLNYLRIIEDKLIDMFPTPSISKKVSNVNCNSYMDEKLKKFVYREPCHAKVIFDFFKLKMLKKS